MDDIDVVVVVVAPGFMGDHRHLGSEILLLQLGLSTGRLRLGL